MSDITYCAYSNCPLKNCSRHITKSDRKSKYVSVCDFAPTCRDYLYYVLEEVEKDNER